MHNFLHFLPLFVSQTVIASLLKKDAGENQETFQLSFHQTGSEYPIARIFISRENYFSSEYSITHSSPWKYESANTAIENAPVLSDDNMPDVHAFLTDLVNIERLNSISKNNLRGKYSNGKSLLTGYNRGMYFLQEECRRKEIKIINLNQKYFPEVFDICFDNLHEEGSSSNTEVTQTQTVTVQDDPELICFTSLIELVEKAYNKMLELGEIRNCDPLPSESVTYHLTFQLHCTATSGVNLALYKKKLREHRVAYAKKYWPLRLRYRLSKTPGIICSPNFSSASLKVRGIDSADMTTVTSVGLGSAGLGISCFTPMLSWIGCIGCLLGSAGVRYGAMARKQHQDELFQDIQDLSNDLNGSFCGTNDVVGSVPFIPEILNDVHHTGPESEEEDCRAMYRIADCIRFNRSSSDNDDVIFVRGDLRLLRKHDESELSVTRSITLRTSRRSLGSEPLSTVRTVTEMKKASQLSHADCVNLIEASIVKDSNGVSRTSENLEHCACCFRQLLLIDDGVNKLEEIELFPQIKQGRSILYPEDDEKIIAEQQGILTTICPLCSDAMSTDWFLPNRSSFLRFNTNYLSYVTPVCVILHGSYFVKRS